MTKKNTSISVGDYFSSFIEAQVASGRFASASEVVREGLRLLEQRESQLQRLRELIREGDESGDPIPLDRDGFAKRMRAEASSKKRDA